MSRYYCVALLLSGDCEPKDADQALRMVRKVLDYLPEDTRIWVEPDLDIEDEELA